MGGDFFERYGEHLDEILENKLYHVLIKSAFADGYAYAGQPIIISEFGGIAFNNSGEGWGYGNKVASKEDYIKRFDSITTAIKKIGAVCGYCYTQVTDVQQEINGIMDMDRRFKVEPSVLKEINERKVSNFYRNIPSRTK
jgi:RNA recognition motif-containing protein